MKSLIGYFAKKTIFVNIIAIFIMFVGFIKFFSSPKEIFPNIEFGMVVITTIYPQASPDEIEKLIANPIEDKVANIKGVKETLSANSESLSMIMVQAEEGYDIKQLTNDIKSAVDKIASLPKEAEEPDVFEISSEEFGMLMMMVSGGTYAERRETVRLIEAKTSKISGVGEIEKWGYSDKTIWVDARKADLERYGLTILGIMNVLQDRNISMPAGNKRINDIEYSVRLVSEQPTASEVSRIVVRSNDAGNNIRLGDIARVTDGFADEDNMFRAGGEEAILMSYNKMVGFDSNKISKEIRKNAENLKHSVSKDIKITFADDFSERLKDRMNVLYSNGTFGAFIVVALLLVFMRPAVAIMVAIGLPVALGGSFLIVESIGMTFNILSLFAFIMVIGMLVDDAIVVGENVYRHMEMGKKPHEAAVEGASEMIMPVIASVSTTIAAFLPLLMVGGMMGKMMGAIPIVISIALAVSVIECFFILPSHLTDFVSYKEKYHTRTDHWFEVFKANYGRLLDKVLRNRVVFAVVIALLFVFSVAAAVMMDKKFSDTQINEITIQFDAANTMGIEDTTRIVKGMEEKLLTLDKGDVDNVIAYVGYQENMSGPPRFAPNIGYVRVLLQLEDKRKTRDANKIVNQIKEMIGARPDLAKFSIDILKGGPSAGADINVIVTGDTYEELEKASAELMELAKNLEVKRGKEKLKPVAEINSDLESGKNEIKLVIDEPKAMRTGVNITQASMLLRAAIAGLKVKSIKTGGENVDIKIRMDENDIKNIEDILALKVPNMMGAMIPLSSVVKVEKGYSYAMIKHKDGRKSVTVTGTVDKVKGNAAQVNMALMKKLDPLKAKYPNVQFESGGEFKAMMDAFADLAFAFFIAVLIIYIILATLFNSLTQPFIIMLAIPFGFIGVILTLLLHGHAITFMSFMGFVGLTGVVVNNSILMTNFIDSLKKGLTGVREIEKAVVEGAMTRLRPVIITTITTFAGLLPLGYGWFGGKDPMLQPMALVFAWGLLFATFVTLFIIPSFIVIWNNISAPVKLFKDRSAGVAEEAINKTNLLG